MIRHNGVRRLRNRNRPSCEAAGIAKPSRPAQADQQTLSKTTPDAVAAKPQAAAPPEGAARKTDTANAKPARKRPLPMNGLKPRRRTKPTICSTPRRQSFAASRRRAGRREGSPARRTGPKTR